MNRHELETRDFVRKFEAPKRCQSHARALEVLGGRVDHAGRVRISHAQLGRVLGLCPRQVQNIVHALRAAGVLRIDAWRGFANVYRVLVDWVLRLIAGESTVARSDAPPLEPSAVPTSAAPSPHPPPISGRWVWPNGACIHAAEACDECRARAAR